MMNFIKMRWLFNKRTAKAVFWMFLLLVIAGLVNLAGIRFAGSIQGWTTWIKAHAAIFLLWRIALYIAVFCGWLWMRKRILKRDTSAEAKTRFMRIEIATVAALLVLEVSNLSA